MILAGDPDAPLARESLAELCNAYWYPLYAYIRRRGYDPEQAQDLTQDFFARLLEKGLLAEADPARGRFRSFLRTVCAHFLANRRDWEHARKRGGGRTVLSIDAADAEGRYARELADGLTPERIFDRSWALTLLGRVLDQLGREYDEAGKAATFEALRGLLDGDLRCALLRGGRRPPGHDRGRRAGRRPSAPPPLRRAAPPARSRPRWPSRPRSTTRSGTSSPPSKPEPPGILIEAGNGRPSFA